MSKQTKSAGLGGMKITSGKLIRHYRTAMGLSQADLATKIGSAHSNISDLERGASAVTEAWRERLAPELGIHADDLIYGTPKRDETHRAIIQIVDNKTPEERQKLLIYLAQQK